MRQSKRVNCSRFVQIQTRWPTACVRTSCEHARNVQTSVQTKNLEKHVVRTSCEWCEHFIQIALLAEISPKNSSNLPKNLHIQICDRKSHGLAQKPKLLIFWPKTTWVCPEICVLDFLTDSCPIFPKPAHFKFSPKIARVFPESCFFFTLTKLARLYPTTCAS